jgi:hypothetical protein
LHTCTAAGYAPRDEEELAFTAAALNTSYAMARGSDAVVGAT